MLILLSMATTYAQQTSVVYEFDPQEDWLSDQFDRSRNQFKGRNSYGFYMTNSHRSHRFFSKTEDFSLDLSRDFDMELKYIYATTTYSNFSQGQYVFLNLEGSDYSLELEYLNSDGNYASCTVRKGWERLDYHSQQFKTEESVEQTLNFKKEGNQIKVYCNGELFRSYTYTFEAEQVNARIRVGVKAETVFTVTSLKVSQTGGSIEENQAPLITILKPGQSRGLEVVKVEAQEVVGVALDDDGISKVLVNGIEANLEEGGKFSLTLPMVVGNNEITVEAFDKYGLGASKTINVRNNEVDPDKDEHVAENKLALVIGNSSYTNSADLQGRPINDANDMVSTLEGIGFKVIKATNASLQEMNDAIRAFGKESKTADVALFFYAGHGLQTDQENYLVPVDAEISSKDDVEFECIKVATIQRLMETNRQDRLNLLILDACRNNPFKSWQRGGDQGLADMTPPSGTLIAFATAPGQTAANGDGRNGLYTGELIKQLKKHQRIEDVFINTRIAVEDMSAGEQSPWELARLRGIYYLIEE